jgi:hypothetical protein
MLLRHDVLRGIESGGIDAVYRKWAAARVKPGTRLRTSVGVLEIIAVDEVDPGSLTHTDARSAGFDSVPHLIAGAGNRGAILYRIGIRYVGPDPRLVLRNSIPDATELAQIQRRLDSFDANTKHGPWTRETLALIATNPGVRAEDLAHSVGREKQPFKLDVRKLKELGLTESLEIGYRLSPRGEAVLGESA